MNKAILMGNLTRDPEVREINSNGKTSKVVNFTLAVSRYYKKANGESEQVTEFLDCEAWDSGADTMSKILNKGDAVLLEGAIKKETWEKDGIKQSKFKIRVEKFNKVSSKRTSSEAAPAQEEQLVAASANGSDIAF